MRDSRQGRSLTDSVNLAGGVAQWYQGFLDHSWPRVQMLALCKQQLRLASNLTSSCLSLPRGHMHAPLPSLRMISVSLAPTILLPQPPPPTQ